MWPAGEVLFKGGVVDAVVYEELFKPIIRSVELVFGSSRSHRWGPEEIKEYQNLALQIGLGYQRHLGPDRCSISVFNNIQIAWDSEIYGHPHNVWCFAGERIVRYYKSIPHNQKNFEISMAKSFARREATRFWLSRHLNICTVDPDMVDPDQNPLAGESDLVGDDGSGERDGILQGEGPIRKMIVVGVDQGWGYELLSKSDTHLFLVDSESHPQKTQAARNHPEPKAQSPHECYETRLCCWRRRKQRFKNL